jgi:hypothetical protein
MTGIVETVLGHAAIRSGEKLKELVLGREADLRLLIRQALVLAAVDSDLPTGVTPEWVADVLIEGRLAADSVPTELAGADPDQSLLLGGDDFASRLKGLMPAELIADLEALDIHSAELFESFGTHLPEVIRSHATDTTSSVRELAARIEASAIERTGEAIASALSVNLEQTGETLRHLRNASKQRTLRRLDALGVPEELFDTVLASIELIPIPVLGQDDLAVIVAEGGSGKSTIAERLHSQALYKAEVDQSAPLPIFIEANRLDGTLRDAIARTWGSNASLMTRGVALVVDGLEEIGTVGARKLIFDIRSMLRDESSPVVTALVTHRPLDLGVRYSNRIKLTLLSDEQASTLISQLSGQRYLSLTYTPAIRDAIHRPFFALAVGLSVAASPSQLHPTPSMVIESVARRVLADVEWDDAANLLSRAAAASVDARHGPISLADFAPTRRDVNALRDTCIVEIRDDRLIFRVSLIAEWFAAEHLRENPGLIETLVEDPKRLDLWRYPLLLATESQSFDQMMPALTAVARTAPAMAGWLLTQPDPFDPARASGDEPSSPHARVLAQRIRTAFSALGEGLEELSTRWKLFAGGTLPPLALATGGRRCDYAWHRADPELPEILESLPSFSAPDLDQNWYRYVSATMTDHPAWPWRHAQGQLREMLEKSIGDRRFFEGAETSRRESTWRIALEALGRGGSLNCTPIGRDELKAVLEKRDQLLRDAGVHNARDDSVTAAVRRLVVDMELDGTQELESPWDTPDNLSSSHGWVWGVWSDSSLLHRVRRATLLGLELYKYAVDSQLSHFASQLRIASAWPVRIVGYMSPDNPTQGLMGQPLFLWYLDLESDRVSADWEIVEDINEVARQLERNRGVGRWAMGELDGIYRPDPATSFGTALLWDDLREWGWTNGRSPRHW